MHNLDINLAKNTLVKIVFLLNIIYILIYFFTEGISVIVCLIGTVLITSIYFIFDGLKDRADNFVEHSKIGRKIDNFAGRRR